MSEEMTNAFAQGRRTGSSSLKAEGHTSSEAYLPPPTFLGDRGFMLIDHSGIPHQNPPNTFQKTRGPRLTEAQYDALDSLSHKHGDDTSLRLRRFPDGRIFAVFIDPFLFIPGFTHHRYHIFPDGTVDTPPAKITGGLR